MNGIAFWSWAYDVARGARAGGPQDFLAKPLRLAVRIARKFTSDPIVSVQLGDRALLMPWSHNIPSILSSNPLYEAEIGRLAQHLAEVDGQVVMIDAGANIGDTVATLPRLSRAKFLCIEGSERYYGLLRMNSASDQRVTLEYALLTDVKDQGHGAQVKEIEGTAHVETTDGSSAAAPWRTLDELLDLHPDFKAANFCKVDCDGYDLRVLKGATALLEKAKPCLHLEIGPQLWRMYGGSEVSDGLEFLFRYGYKDVLIYDNLGYFIARDSVQNSRVLDLLADYAMRHPSWFYLNVIAFHESRKDLEQFYKRETDEAAAISKNQGSSASIII
jgi:FkbM family methyltransferase